jgi:hypothetical protein
MIPKKVKQIIDNAERPQYDSIKVRTYFLRLDCRDLVFGLVYLRLQPRLRTQTDKAKGRVQIIPIAKANDQIKDQE